MSEPRLEDIGDYDTLKGQKKKVVLLVIIGAIVMSIIYIAVDHYYGTVKDGIKIEDNIKYIPLK